MQITLEDIQLSRRKYKNPYAHLNGDGGLDAAPAQHIDLGTENKINKSTAIKHTPPNKPVRRSAKEIESLVVKFQNEMWRNYKKLHAASPSDPLELLDPELAFNYLGYDFQYMNASLHYTEGDELIEVGAFLDESSKQVRVAVNSNEGTTRFTAAHELGHALLHNAPAFHRDRGLDGQKSSKPRDQFEYEADKAATFFLMPGKIVVKEFQQRFESCILNITEETCSALSPKVYEEFMSGTLNKKELYKTLACIDQYGQNNFVPLFNKFRVSSSAMAIRLEELRLIAL